MIHHTTQLCRFDFDDNEIKDFFQTTHPKRYVLFIVKEYSNDVVYNAHIFYIGKKIKENAE